MWIYCHPTWEVCDSKLIRKTQNTVHLMMLMCMIFKLKLVMIKISDINVDFHNENENSYFWIIHNSIFCRIFFYGWEPSKLFDDTVLIVLTRIIRYNLNLIQMILNVSMKCSLMSKTSNSKSCKFGSVFFLHHLQYRKFFQKQWSFTWM